MDDVQVAVPYWELLDVHHKLVESLIMDRLRNAGIPIRPSFTLRFKGIERGVLKQWHDPVSNALCFRWQDDVTEAGQS